MPFEPIADPTYLRSVIRISLTVSLTAVFLSTLLSLPIAFVVGFADFPGKRLLTSIINTGMGFPSVAVGLLVLLRVYRGLSQGDQDHRCHVRDQAARDPGRNLS